MSFAITASIVMGVGTAAYSANRQRKAQEQAEQNSLYQRLTIEGQAPQLLDIGSGVADQPVIGSDISEALGNLRYNPEASFTQMLQSGEVQQGQQAIPPEVLEQLMMEQQAQFASGGPVGRPEDIYYFSVEDIQGMMQEPDPMMQAVGAGLMGQMPPGGGMVPATPGQIQMMANGGQPLYRDMGGQTNIMTTDPRDVGPDYDETVMLESSDSDELVEGVDYFNIGGQFFWPWELQAAIPDGFQNAKKISNFLESLPEKPSIKELLRLKNLATPGQLLTRFVDDGIEEVPIRRQEGGITAVKKLENTLSELVGINPKDVEWASSLSEEMYPGEELDGRGDAARHLALGSLIAKAEHPNAAEALSVLREYIPIPDSGRKMDMFNNDLGMTLTGSKPEIKKQIRELIENNTAMYMNLDESQKMRGY